MDIDNFINDNEIINKNDNVNNENQNNNNNTQKYNEYKYLNFDDYLKELNQEKESFNTETTTNQKEFIENNINLENQNETSATIKLKKTTAKVITKSIDKAFSFAASLISLSEDNEFGADKDDLDDLIDVWTQTLPSHKSISPGIQLLILYPMIYGPIFKKAFDVRKYNKRIKELEEINFEKEKEIKELKFNKIKEEIKNENKNISEPITNISNKEKKEITPEIIEKILELRTDFVPMQKIAEIIGISYNQVRKICKKL